MPSVTRNPMVPNVQFLKPSWRMFWRSFRIAARLGWKIESNWTDPFLFAVYSIIKPLAGAAILVVMYGIITQGNFEDPLFIYMYLGNAFYMYVGQVMTGISWAVIDDREHYRTLKYMYIAPIHMPSYLLGRGVARFIVASISVFITLLVGIVFLNVQIKIPEVNWGLFTISLLIGVLMLAMMGLILAGISLIIVNHVWFLGDTVAGALYLLSGAIFPLDVLPNLLKPIGFFMPITYWLELLRRSLVGSVADAFPTLSVFTNIQLMGILLGLSGIFAGLSAWVFYWCEHQAKERGLIDMTTNY